MSRSVPLPLSSDASANAPPSAKSLIGPAALIAMRRRARLEPGLGGVDERVREDQHELDARARDAAAVGGAGEAVGELVQRHEREAAGSRRSPPRCRRGARRRTACRSGARPGRRRPPDPPRRAATSAASTASGTPPSRRARRAARRSGRSDSEVHTRGRARRRRRPGRGASDASLSGSLPCRRPRSERSVEQARERRRAGAAELLLGGRDERGQRAPAVEQAEERRLRVGEPHEARRRGGRAGRSARAPSSA